MTGTHWKLPGDIGLWVINLEQDADALDRCLALLSDDELTRAHAFRSAAARRRFVITRAALRCLISMTTGVHAQALRLGTTEHGKPIVPESDLTFSVAHSHDRALIALAWRRRIGVDLEWRGGADPADLWPRVGAVESARSADLPTDARRDAFFRVWTRKEALLKGLGTGLRTPLDAFEVPIDPWTRPFAPRSATRRDEAARWRIVDVPLDDAYAAALAFEKRRLPRPQAEEVARAS